MSRRGWFPSATVFTKHVGVLAGSARTRVAVAVPVNATTHASLLSHHDDAMYVAVRHAGLQWHWPGLLSRAVHHMFLTESQDLQFASDCEHHVV